MKVLIISQDGALLSMAMKAQREGHEVKFWLPKERGGKRDTLGTGLVMKVLSWQAWMKWADLIITSTNQMYMRELAPYFNQGYPIFGCNPKSAELELDRAKGQEAYEEAGIEIIPYKIFTSYEDAIVHVTSTKATYVSKPWGGADDKSLSYVSKSPDDMIWKLSCWSKAGKLKGKIMLQERVKGIEMAVGGWFGPGGWSKWKCENFEHKKFMNGDLGCNTGEQGTVLKYVQESKLFDLTLAPLTGLLYRLGYVGYVDQNCIIDKQGKPWVLESTMRFGYPLHMIQEALHRGDSMQWKLDLLQGKDNLEVNPHRVALGICLTHGKFPCEPFYDPNTDGVPLYGLTEEMLINSLFLVEAKKGVAPIDTKPVEMIVSDGAWIGTLVSLGYTIKEAHEKVYNMCKKLEPPTNLMYRTDIGCKLEKQLEFLHKHYFAEEFDYD